MRSLEKNTASLLFMQGASMAAMTFLTIVLARSFGPRGFGVYSLAVSFTGLLSVFVHLGVDRYVTREIARHKSRAKALTASALGLRITSSIIVFAATVVAVDVIGYGALTKDVIYLFAVYTAFTLYAKLYKALFQAYERMDLETKAEVATRFIIAGAGTLAVYLGAGIVEVALVFVAASVYDFLASTYLSTRFTTPSISSRNWKKLVNQSYPFFLSSAFLMVSFKIDTVMLSLMHPEQVVGWYGSAYKLIEALNIVPTAIVVAAYPVYSRLYVKAKDALKKEYMNTQRVLVAIALPVAVGTALTAQKIIPGFYGQEYLPAVFALQLLVAGELFVFIRYGASTLLNAADLQKKNLKIAASGALLNVGLNLALIPGYAQDGAAAATLATEAAMCALALYVASKHGYRMPDPAKAVFSVSVMALIVYALKDAHLAVTVTAAALTYAFMLLLTGYVNKKQLLDTLGRLRG